MTRFLADTHVWLWLQTEPDRLPGDVLEQLADDRNDLLLSAASSWEITIKHALGKLSLPRPPHIYVPDRMRRTGTVGLAIQHDHALGVGQLPLHHRDPFDRLLVSQARALRLRLVTADGQLERYEVDLELVS